ncbi:hypothetical protein JKP88DRAFT_270086 [Tribonema minus]|uniref:Uncharacterized protein n=1 Tax=Tribonema minus TaxID=303371 RepID=A0A835YW41_9STRA|nr:hypothetical protein JKP88DRAFT_270086 [Tribonema minus]
MPAGRKLAAALVTGGASGLGRATALRLAASGKFGVVVADLKNSEPLPKNVVFAQTDASVCDEAQVNAALDLAKQHFEDEVSVAVNCAGLAYARRTLNSKQASRYMMLRCCSDRQFANVPHDLKEFSRILHINTVGTFNVLRLAAQRMASRPADADGQRGVVVNTASIAAYEGQEGQAAYAASKGAIVALTLPCARDLAHAGVRVCAIAPGLFMTPLLAALPPRVREELGATVPNPPRLGDPDEFARLVEAIVANHMLNGEVIRLDGALRMPAC